MIAHPSMQGSRSSTNSQWMVVGQWLLVAGILISAAIVFLWSNAPYDIDDAPITYRYAENLAAGNGFVYNVGERIQGTSAPLYVILLAALRVLGIPVPLASNVINLLASVGVVAATIVLVKQLIRSFWAGILAGVILLVQGSFLRYSMAGMETPLYTLIIVLALLACVRSQTVLAAGIAGLAAIMRLDGVVVIVAVLLVSVAERRRLPIRELIVFAAVAAPWYLFAWIYFGSPFPLSMLAKQGHRVVGNVSRFWIWEQLFLVPLRFHLYLLPCIMLGLLTALWKRTYRSRWLALVAWLCLYIIEYTLVGIDFYEWYLMPVFPALASLAALGILTALRALRDPLRMGRIAPVIVFVGVGFVLTLYSLNARDSVLGFREYLNTVERSRVLAGEWLRDYAPVKSTILMGAIGHVGYVSNRYVLDSAGLVTPRSYLVQAKPDYYVLDDVSKDPRCGPVADFETHWSFPQMTVVSGCSGSQGVFDTLRLAEVRVTDWIRGASGKWEKASRPYLETQWVVESRRLDRDWTLYVHFTRPDGTKIVQADHPLGLQADDSVLAPTNWPVGSKVHDYKPLPEEAQLSGLPMQVRLGLWDPVSGDRLEVQPVSASKDVDGRLVVELKR